MKAFLKKGFVGALLATALLSAQAQTGNPQVIVANGGVFGPANTITIASWDLTTGQYLVFDSLPASSVQHIAIHDRTAYLCADSFFVAYDLDAHQRRAIATIAGVRQSALTAQGTILVSKGYGAVGDFVEERSTQNLALLHTYPGIGGECEGIVVHNDSAYVAVPLGFGASTGKIAVLDLQNHAYQHSIDLDSNGRIIKNLYLAGETIYSINQVSYSGSYGIVSSYNTTTASLGLHRIDLPTSQGAGIFQDKLYASFGGGIGGWSLTTQTLVDTNVVAGYWAATVLDSVRNRFYVTETDYATYGNLYAYDMNGLRLDSIAIGVSPEAIAVDYNIVTSNTLANEGKVDLLHYPQPFGERLTICLRGLSAKPSTLKLMDLHGRIVQRNEAILGDTFTLHTSDLVPGIYLLQVTHNGRTWTEKVVKGL